MAKYYKILDPEALWQPPERPYLAILDFGLASGFLAALVIVIFTLLGMNHMVTSFIQFLESFYPGYGRPLGTGDLLLGAVYGFFHGFLFGMLLAYIYNRWRAPAPCGVKLIKPQRMVSSRNPVVISAGAGNPPYTLLIMANPAIENENILPDEPGRFRPDPILTMPKLFQAKVACIIGSLARNEMLRDNFLDKMRILTLFDPKLVEENSLHEVAFCLESHKDLIIEPVPRVYEKVNGTYKVKEFRLLEFLKKYPEFYDHSNNRSLVDVVFVVTASFSHTRSSALFTIDKEDMPGKKFTLKYADGRHFERHHLPFAEEPGLIAYSAWDNRIKTPLHEFAHAMSSYTHGTIHDEYYDDIPEELQDAALINKHPIRDHEMPEIFAWYGLEGAEPKPFRSDLSVVKPTDWSVTVPARVDLRLPCTMDISDDLHRFDMLIEQFMFDRLTFKSQRS